MIQQFRLRALLTLILLIAVAISIYSNTINAPFYFDDEPNILNNTGIRVKDFSLNSLIRIASQSAHNERFFPNLTFAVNYYWHGYDVKWFHLFNIFIHITSGGVYYLFLRRFLYHLRKNRYIEFAPETETRSIRLIPIFAFGIWLVHPVQIQAVTYIVQRMTSLAALFYMLTIVCYMDGRVQQQRGKAILYYIVSISSALIAFTCKPNTITLPFYIFIIEWAFFRQLRIDWLRKWMLYFLGLGLVGVLAFYLLKLDLAAFIKKTYVPFDFTPQQRVLTEFRVVLYYISLLIWPHPGRLNLDYDFPLSNSIIQPISTLFAILVVLGMILWAIFHLKKHFVPAFTILWFFGQLVVESSIIGLDLVFEHRLYMPSMLPVFAAVYFLFKRVQRIELSAVILILLTGLYSFWTYQRNEIWRDPISLWSDCIKKAPDNARPYNNLGKALLDGNKFEEAVTVLTKGYEKDPQSVQLMLNLAVALCQTGKPEKALTLFNKGIALEPNNADIYYNLGRLHTMQGNSAAAREFYIKALQINPRHKEAMFNLAGIMFQSGNLKLATSLYQQVLLLDPSFNGARQNLNLIKDLMIQTE